MINRSLRKQVEIGEAAASFFNKKGCLETNVDDIAAAAKVSKGELYHYFSSKDEILFPRSAIEKVLMRK
jgi:TetR/AcrR family transcriptional repressor of nem operon